MAEKRIVASDSKTGDESLERDARLKALFEETKCLIYLPALKQLGLKDFEDLAALSNDEYNVVCNRVDMLYIDKLRLKRAIVRRTRGSDATTDSSVAAAETATTRWSTE